MQRKRAMILFFFRQVMEQDQAETEKERDEAAQHPGSEVKWVAVPCEKTDRVESEGQGHAQCCDEDPPAQQRLTIPSFRAGESLFGQGQRFLVVQIADERDKSKDDEQDSKDSETGNEHVHNSLA